MDSVGSRVMDVSTVAGVRERRRVRSCFAACVMLCSLVAALRRTEKPLRGGHRGSERREGRAMTGATRPAPHPSRRTSAVPRATAVPATCLRRRKGSEGAPPPPPPPPPTPTKERGEGNGEKARGQEG